MKNLDNAIKLAVNYHKGQVDKAGQPYILHPLRVMLQMDTDEERIVAVLHDLIEDTPVSLDQLRQNGFSETVVEAVTCLTKKDGEDYDSYINRAGNNKLARKVKLADLKDNMNIARLSNITDKDRKRLEKYKRVYKKLIRETINSTIL